jgi:threonine dehydrogenase-like Zn-dependent dehydrogenase
LAAINEPVHQAAFMCRKRGRIVLVGVTGLELSRADFYEKELTFQVSCSYGPGRYDPNYEEKGQDYPIGFVRWTEQRNFEAVLDMLADGRLAVKPLISHRFPIEAAETAVLIPAFRAAGARLHSIASSGGVSGDHAGRKSAIFFCPSGR